MSDILRDVLFVIGPSPSYIRFNPKVLLGSTGVSWGQDDCVHLPNSITLSLDGSTTSGSFEF